ncbi:MAG: hypothetical protein WDA42_07815 [Candidatus Bathyarchaeia archaeon]
MSTPATLAIGVLSLCYTVSVVGDNGYTIVLDSTHVIENSNIIVANVTNGTALKDDYCPLSLTISNLTKRESAKGISTNPN